MANCSFCGRRQEEVALLIAGPPPRFICDECVATMLEGLSLGQAKAGSYSFVCGFCGTTTHQPLGASMSHEGRICESCLQICADILELEAQAERHRPVINAYKAKRLGFEGSIQD